MHVLLTGGDLARLLQRDRCRELDLVRRLGNWGLHEGWLEEAQAKASIRYLHGFLTWLYESYAIRGECEPPLSAFREEYIPEFFPSKRKELQGDGFDSGKQMKWSPWLEVMRSIIAFLLSILFSPLLITAALIRSKQAPSRVNIQDEVGYRASFSFNDFESRSDVYEGTMNLTVPEPQIYSRRGIAPH